MRELEHRLLKRSTQDAVLQYRYLIKIEETHLIPGTQYSYNMDKIFTNEVWSDWQDVPVVEDENEARQI